MNTDVRWRLMFRIEPQHVLHGLLVGPPENCLARIEGGAPADAVFVRMHVDPLTQCLLAVFEHPSFEARYRACGLSSCDDAALLCAPTPAQTVYFGPDVKAVIGAPLVVPTKGA